jgi:hypothetical protein
MDPKLKANLEAIFKKGITSLTEIDKNYLKARQGYLTEEQKVIYKDVLKKKEVIEEQVVEVKPEIKPEVEVEKVRYVVTPASSPAPTIVEVSESEFKGEDIKSTGKEPEKQVIEPVIDIAQPITFDDDHSKDPDFKG